MNSGELEEHVPSVSSNRIQARKSPYLDSLYGHIPFRLTIDSGATGNMIRASTVTRLGGRISGSSYKGLFTRRN
jgi:hypothetical protein